MAAYDLPPTEHHYTAIDEAPETNTSVGFFVPQGSPMAIATIKGNLKEIMRLQQDGINVNLSEAELEHHCPPIIAAMHYEQVEAFDYLYTQGAYFPESFDDADLFLAICHCEEIWLRLDQMGLLQAHKALHAVNPGALLAKAAVALCPSFIEYVSKYWGITDDNIKVANDFLAIIESRHPLFLTEHSEIITMLREALMQEFGWLPNSLTKRGVQTRVCTIQAYFK